MVMVGPSSWAALEVTSAEPGLPPLNNGSAVMRQTSVTPEEAERANKIDDVVIEVFFIG